MIDGKTVTKRRSNRWGLTRRSQKRILKRSKQSLSLYKTNGIQWRTSALRSHQWYSRSAKVRKLGGSIYAVVVMLVSMDKTETNTIPVTTYGSFQDFTKTGERWRSYAPLNHSNYNCGGFSLNLTKNCVFCEWWLCIPCVMVYCLRLLYNMTCYSGKEFKPKVQTKNGA